VQELTEAVRLSSDKYALGYLGYAYGRAGQREQALKVLVKLDTAVSTEKPPPVALALIHVGLGETDKALDWPDRAALANQTGMDLLLDLSSDRNEDKELQAASLLLMALSFVSKASTSSCLFKAINS
jgi:hypothetical protein